MTSLKSLMDRRSLQVLDMRAMKNLKGGKKGQGRGEGTGSGSAGNPPPGHGDGDG